MLSVFKQKNNDLQLVVMLELDEEFENCVTFGIEERYGGNTKNDRFFTVYSNIELLKIYNTIGKALGYPEMKGK